MQPLEKVIKERSIPFFVFSSVGWNAGTMAGAIVALLDHEVILEMEPDIFQIPIYLKA